VEIEIFSNLYVSPGQYPQGQGMDSSVILFGNRIAKQSSWQSLNKEALKAQTEGNLPGPGRQGNACPM